MRTYRICSNALSRARVSRCAFQHTLHRDFRLVDSGSTRDSRQIQRELYEKIAGRSNRSRSSASSRARGRRRPRRGTWRAPAKRPRSPAPGTPPAGRRPAPPPRRARRYQARPSFHSRPARATPRRAPFDRDVRFLSTLASSRKGVSRMWQRSSSLVERAARDRDRVPKRSRDRHTKSRPLVSTTLSKVQIGTLPNAEIGRYGARRRAEPTTQSPACSGKMILVFESVSRRRVS